MQRVEERRIKSGRMFLSAAVMPFVRGAAFIERFPTTRGGVGMWKYDTLVETCFFHWAHATVARLNPSAIPPVVGPIGGRLHREELPFRRRWRKAAERLNNLELKLLAAHGFDQLMYEPMPEAFTRRQRVAAMMSSGPTDPGECAAVQETVDEWEAADFQAVRCLDEEVPAARWSELASDPRVMRRHMEEVVRRDPGPAHRRYSKVMAIFKRPAADGRRLFRVVLAFCALNDEPSWVKVKYHHGGYDQVAREIARQGEYTVTLDYKSLFNRPSQRGGSRRVLLVQGSALYGHDDGDGAHPQPLYLGEAQGPRGGAVRTAVHRQEGGAGARGTAAVGGAGARAAVRKRRRPAALSPGVERHTAIMLRLRRETDYYYGAVSQEDKDLFFPHYLAPYWASSPIRGCRGSGCTRARSSSKECAEGRQRC